MENQLLKKKIRETHDLMQRSGMTFSDPVVSAFAEALSGLSGWETFRINPLAFAEKHHLDPAASLSLFIYGSKSGLFRFEWNLLCPYCGGREHSHRTLNQLEKIAYHCTVCDLDVKVEADSHLEVSFSLQPEAGGKVPDHYRSLMDYSQFHFSSYLVLPPLLADAFAKQPSREYIPIPPGRAGRYAGTISQLPASRRMRIVTLDTHSILNVYFKTGQAPETQRLEVFHSDKGFNLVQAEFIAPGKIEIIVRNQGRKPIGILSTWANTQELWDAYQQAPAYFLPFVTGKMMLNNQHFRELFLVDNLPDDLSLKVNDITLMFTDLKGSTELYDKTGDINAYRLVQKHFSILQQIVSKKQGAVVKTMGDAIMASFNNPISGVEASLDMLTEIDEFNRNYNDSGNAIGLKIGLHRGPVIAVKANQTLDYFGQTVNIAARVQALAGAGELWMTKDMLRDQDISRELKQAGRQLIPKEVALKGVGNKMEVYQCEGAACT